MTPIKPEEALKDLNEESAGIIKAKLRFAYDEGYRNGFADGNEAGKTVAYNAVQDLLTRNKSDTYTQHVAKTLDDPDWMYANKPKEEPKGWVQSDNGLIYETKDFLIILNAYQSYDLKWHWTVFDQLDKSKNTEGSSSNQVLAKLDSLSRAYELYELPKKDNIAPLNPHSMPAEQPVWKWDDTTKSDKAQLGIGNYVAEVFLDNKVRSYRASASSDVTRRRNPSHFLTIDAAKKEAWEMALDLQAEESCAEQWDPDD